MEGSKLLLYNHSFFFSSREWKSECGTLAMIHIWIREKCNGFTPHQSRENNRLLLPCQQVQVSVNVGGGLVVGVDFPVERGVLSRFLWDYSHHHQTANTITRKWQFHELWPLNLIQCMLVHNYKSMFFINFKTAIISRNYNFQIQYKTYRLIITKKLFQFISKL